MDGILLKAVHLPELIHILFHTHGTAFPVLTGNPPKTVPFLDADALIIGSGPAPLLLGHGSKHGTSHNNGNKQ